MCGRYTFYDMDEAEKHFNITFTSNVTPNYNVAPTQSMPIIRMINGAKTVDILHWGIPRMLGKDLVREIINTRSDKAFGRFWKKQVTTQRCLIPANSFYEWKKTNDGKVPFLIKPNDSEIFAFAGIWSSWTGKDGESFDSYSIMTTEPNKEMTQVHDRMPVILSKNDEAAWLSDTMTLILLKIY